MWQVVRKIFAPFAFFAVSFCSELIREIRAIRGKKTDRITPTWGFEIPDVWVVGYGLDSADMFRTLPYIASAEAGSIRIPVAWA